MRGSRGGGEGLSVMVKKLIFALSFSNYVHAMRFIVTSNDLLQQLLTVAKAISSKSVAEIGRAHV